jgi:hypothetical protein
MKDLEKVPKELKGSAALEEEYQYELTSPPPTHPQELMSLATYVAEDGLVSHQWEERERPLVLQRSYTPIQGNARARKQEWVGWGVGWEESTGGFGDSI